MRADWKEDGHKHSTSGGTRQDVLDTIAIVRPREPAAALHQTPPPAKYPAPLTPEQGAEWEARRAELDLG